MAKQPASAERDRVVDDRLRGVELLALHLEAAERVDRLRRQPDVAHDGDLGVEDGRDRVEPLAPAFELHRAGAGADERGGVVHGLVAAHVVAEPRQIADDQRARLRAGDRADVVHHVVDRHLQRVVVAEHDHGDGVADEDHVDPGGVDHAGRRRVVRRDHHERSTLALRVPDPRRGHRQLRQKHSSLHLHRPGPFGSRRSRAA